jgi:REP element-mobilizing transposase RayT
MANTYSQINVHCVFAVKGRENLIGDSFKDALFKYMYGILKNDNAFPLAVGGCKDHVHVFFELSPNNKVADLMRNLKSASSKWINDSKLVGGKFQWQDGYGAFSYSRSQRDTIVKYIVNQEEHHSIKTFKEEYLELLEQFEIEINLAYLFEFYEDDVELP